MYQHIKVKSALMSPDTSYSECPLDLLASFFDVAPLLPQWARPLHIWGLLVIGVDVFR